MSAQPAEPADAATTLASTSVPSPTRQSKSARRWGTGPRRSGGRSRPEPSPGDHPQWDAHECPDHGGHGGERGLGAPGGGQAPEAETPDQAHQDDQREVARASGGETRLADGSARHRAHVRSRRRFSRTPPLHRFQCSLIVPAAPRVPPGPSWGCQHYAAGPAEGR